MDRYLIDGEWVSGKDFVATQNRLKKKAKEAVEREEKAIELAKLQAKNREIELARAEAKAHNEKAEEKNKTATPLDENVKPKPVPKPKKK